VELAHGGTLFLDEIGDITPQVQVKLLRLLQEHEFERLGSTRTLKVDVRFVAATHRHLEEMVRRGEFRENLFYHLNFLDVHARSNGQPPFSLQSEALAVLQAQPPLRRASRPTTSSRSTG
jgi:two-component system, NtrC family, response regulator AtoC